MTRFTLSNNTNEYLLPHYINNPSLIMDEDLFKLHCVYQSSLLVNHWVTSPLDFDTLKEKDDYGLIPDGCNTMGSFLRHQVKVVDGVLTRNNCPEYVSLAPRIQLFYQTIKERMNTNRSISKANVDLILRRFHVECQDKNNQQTFNSQRSQIARRSQSVDSVFHKRKCKLQNNADFFGLAYPSGKLPDKYSISEGARTLRHAFSSYRQGVNPKKMGFSDFPGQVYMQYHYTPLIGPHWSVGFCGLEQTEMEDLKSLMLELWLDVYPKGHLLTPQLKDRSVSDVKTYLKVCMSHKTLLTPNLPAKTHTILRSS